MSDNFTSSFSNQASRTDWVRIHQMTDADIDYSDSPAAGEAFWAEAEWWMPVSKTRLSLRLDSDVVEWFKAQGPGYQGRINAVLRAYVRSKAKA
ncbi:MAG: BrnA antitoxin family protein [Firmicutes bacterium]|nr:BrnA antitoxin family protein [Bacillota bacterium]MCL5066702.1 BrnA antitoxin family protein [Bacillota bacterium]